MPDFARCAVHLHIRRLEGEDESMFLSESAGSDDGMDGLRMRLITYRIATGRDAGCKVVTLQTLPGDTDALEGDAGKVGDTSLRAGVATEAQESQKLERPCRYITRPAISGFRSRRRMGSVTTSRSRSAMAPPTVYLPRTPPCARSRHRRGKASGLLPTLNRAVRAQTTEARMSAAVR